MATVAPIRHREAPSNADAEAALLGAMLLERAAAEAALAAGVTAADFWTPDFALIYDAILTVRHRDERADPTTVAAELANRDQLDRVGGRRRLLELQAHTPASTGAAPYARIVHDLATHRRLINTLEATTAAAYNADRERVAELLEQLHAPEGTASTWQPVDLTDVLAGDLEPPDPLYLRRDDGQHLLYPGQIHAFAGESESLKSWLALIATAQQLAVGANVVYLDFETSPRAIISRLLALGATPQQITTQLTYLRPEEALGLANTNRLDRLITTLTPTVVIIDGVTEAMGIEGLDLLSNADVAIWLERLPRRIRNHGPAVLMIDHVPKNNDRTSLIGGQHKKAGIDVVYIIEAKQRIGRLGPTDLEPMTGISKITIDKDRDGALRGHSLGGKHAGELHLTAYPDGGLTGRIIPALDTSDSSFRPTFLMKRISDALTAAPAPLSKSAIRGGVKGNNATKDLALELLIADGYVIETSGPRNSRLFSSVRPYTIPDDRDTPPADPGDAF